MSLLQKIIFVSLLQKWTLLLLSLIFVSLLQLNRMHCEKLWFWLYIYVCMQSEIRIFRTLVVRCKHTWNKKFWHTFSLHMQNFQFQTKNLNETPKCWLLILAGCKYICGPLQPCQTYVWPAKWVIILIFIILFNLATSAPSNFSSVNDFPTEI